VDLGSVQVDGLVELVQPLEEGVLHVNVIVAGIASELHADHQVLQGDFLHVLFHELVHAGDDIVDIVERPCFPCVGELHEIHVVQLVGECALVIDESHEPDLQLFYLVLHQLFRTCNTHFFFLVENSLI